MPLSRTAIPKTDQYRIQTETRLLKKKMGFTGAFLFLQHLDSQMEKYPSPSLTRTFTVLLTMIRSEQFQSRKQAYFLYKAALKCMIQIILKSARYQQQTWIEKLQHLCMTLGGSRQRAVSEALGTLPLIFRENHPGHELPHTILHISLPQLLSKADLKLSGTFTWKGRTLVNPTCEGTLFCVKCLKNGQAADSLLTEIQWLSAFNTGLKKLLSATELPVPIIIDQSALFKISRLPMENTASGSTIALEPIAICFIAPKTYFDYINEPESFFKPGRNLLAAFEKNAWQLGRLASRGIIHTALIPLFHNRVQQSRRQDQGLYKWPQGGRLDQWLNSSRFPNLATSGIRDFEHFERITHSRDLVHFIGQHVLSLILLAGSYFRNKAPDLFGTQENGKPMDLRYLFDPMQFHSLVKIIIQAYYTGLTGFQCLKTDVLAIELLADRLIDVMGQDIHMDEILRAHDQEVMSNDEFDHFLSCRGITKDQKKELARGQGDIVLKTGPHLGEFSRRISVPELIEFLFKFSSLCVSDCYLAENGLKPSVK